MSRVWPDRRNDAENKKAGLSPLRDYPEIGNIVIKTQTGLGRLAHARPPLRKTKVQLSDNP